MPSTFSTNLKIELMSTGENSGTWGTVTNTNLGTALEQAVVGYGNPNYSSDANLTITLTDSNAAQAARALVLNVTSSVSLTGTRELVVPTIQKQYIVQNNTTGSQSITVKTSAGTGVTIPNGKKMHVYVDGTNVVQMDDFALIFNVDNLTLDGNTLSSTNTNGNIVIAPDGTGDVQLDADTVRIGDSNANVTLTTNGTSDLILNTNAGTNSGSITIEDGVNGNIIIAPNGTGQVQITNAALDLTTIEVSNINAKDGTAAITIADSTGAVGISTAVTMSATTQNIALGTSQTTGTFTVGGASQTGALTLDQSTKTHTLNLGTGATESGLTKTINLGTAGVSGSTTAITVGSANGTTTTLNGTVTAATFNSTTIDTTNLEVTNIKAKDGTAALSIADSTGVVSVSANPVLSGGTANGVAYLNASKALTTGSALTFDGTRFGVNGGLVADNNLVAQINSPANSAKFMGFNRDGGYGLLIGYDLGGVDYATIRTVGNYPISFGINNAEAMRLNSTSLNIGGNFTSTNNTLQVTGNAAIGDTLAGPTDGLYVKGNVGIGTNNPAAKLDLNASASNAQLAIQNWPLIRAVNTTIDIGGYNASQWTAMRLYANNSIAVTIDSSGNLGLGVTPSAWSLGKAFQVNSGALWSQANNAYVVANAYYNAGYKYLNTGYASAYEMGSGTHIWYTAPSGTAGNAISFTQAMTLDASGNLGIGTTSPTAKLTTSTARSATLTSAFFGTSGTGAVNDFNKLTLQVQNTLGGSTGGAAIGAVLEASASNKTGLALYYDSGSGAQTEGARLDSSGNLGLGVTPSAWGGAQKPAIQIGTGGSFIQGRNDAFSQIQVGANAFYNGTNWKYVNDGFATRYYQSAGVHAWSISTSGTAGNNVSFTEAMTLDASGNLLVGTTSSAYSSSNRVVIEVNGTTDSLFALKRNNTNNFYLQNASDGVYINNTAATPTIFNVNGGERARITSGGYFKASNSGTYDGSTGAYHEFYQTANDQVLNIRCTSTAFTDSALLIYNDRTTTNGSYNHIACYNGNFTGQFIVKDSGDCQNSNNSYAGTSDIKLKQDIVDAASQWNDIKSLRVRKYRFKDKPNEALQIGVIAQELEQVSPGLVEESADRDAEGNDLGTTTKSVKYSILYMKAVKALQEAMARIEKLEAEVAALKGV